MTSPHKTLQQQHDERAVEIRKQIDILHKKSAGAIEWYQLEKQVKQKVVQLPYNAAQLVSRQHIHHPDYQLHYDRWGRGTGKTTSIGGKVVHVAHSMPRAVGTFISPSYKFLLTRIIPSIVNGLELHGWYQGLHYFIGEKPPRSWRWAMPYQPPKDYSKFLITHTGFGLHMISQDVAGDGRGLNTDIEFGDESALLDYGMMEENTTPTLRGSKVTEFRENPLFTKRFHHSSMPLTQSGAWVFDLEEKNLMGEKSALIIDANCKVNLHNLKHGYLEDAKKTSINDVIYDAEYLNIRPPLGGPDSFYPLLSENVHGYRSQDHDIYAKHDDCRADSDLVTGVPLFLGVDFGSAVNFISVAQHLRSIAELRALNQFFVTSQDRKIQDDAVTDFHDYYKYHQNSNKEIFLCYDKTGNVETGNTRQTRAEQMRDQLTKLGWQVRLLTVGRTNPDHSLKFAIWEKILQNTRAKFQHRQYPCFRINIIRARTLLISMYNSKTKEGRNNSIHKDKSIEAKMLKQGRAHLATHGSDAFDTIIEALFADTERFGLFGVGLPDISMR
jgi:hypothetical protein